MGGKWDIGFDMGMKAVRGGETGSSDFSWGSFTSPSSSRRASLVQLGMLSAIRDAIGFSLNWDAIRLILLVTQDSFSTPIPPSLKAELRFAEFTLV